MEAVLAQVFPAVATLADQLQAAIETAPSVSALLFLPVSIEALTESLSHAMFQLHLLGRAQVWAEVAPSPAVPPQPAAFAALVLEDAFQPLPFAEAITFFADKLPVSRSVFDTLTDAARAKSFTIAAGVTEQIRTSIQDILTRALSEGVTLREFQALAAEVLDRAGVSARAPWYWETVYRTNLQQSYQVGRWRQMTDPSVQSRRPFLRYTSARLPTSRPSHVEKHGVILPTDDPFWDRWAPPNGYNCYCSLHSVSQAAIDRNGWTVGPPREIKYPNPDTGFAFNAGTQEQI